MKRVCLFKSGLFMDEKWLESHDLVWLHDIWAKRIRSAKILCQPTSISVEYFTEEVSLKANICVTVTRCSINRWFGACLKCHYKRGHLYIQSLLLKYADLREKNLGGDCHSVQKIFYLSRVAVAPQNHCNTLSMFYKGQSIWDGRQNFEKNMGQ